MDISIRRVVGDPYLVEVVINGTPTMVQIKAGGVDVLGVIAPAIVATLDPVQLRSWPPKARKKT